MKKIGGAGLDVYEEEAEYFFEDFSNSAISDDVLARLMTFPNVLITSHQAFFPGKPWKTSPALPCGISMISFTTAVWRTRYATIAAVNVSSPVKNAAGERPHHHICRKAAPLSSLNTLFLFYFPAFFITFRS
jgi:hypothetical protein